MGEKYNQLSLEERAVIGHLHANGQSLAEIGRQIGRPTSTVSRELARNSKATKSWPGGYDAARAQDLSARRRRWDGRFKLVRQPELADRVRKLLAMGWSPEMIDGRLARMKSSMRISHESIYRFIYHRVASKDYTWHVLLPRHKFYRGHRPKKGGPACKTFESYVSIDKRPESAASRKRHGHWEGDLMSFRHNKDHLLIAHERKTRMTFAFLQPNKSAGAVRQNLTGLFKPLPSGLRRSITYDNGTEFAQHHLVNAETGMKSYFCHTHSPWQKGGVENAVGRLRRDLPRKTDISKMTQENLNTIIEQHNNRPRKCLAYLTPKEVWNKCQRSTRVALQT